MMTRIRNVAQPRPKVSTRSVNKSLLSPTPKAEAEVAPSAKLPPDTPANPFIQSQQPSPPP